MNRMFKRTASLLSLLYRLQTFEQFYFSFFCYEFSVSLMYLTQNLACIFLMFLYKYCPFYKGKKLEIYNLMTLLNQTNYIVLRNFVVHFVAHFVVSSQKQIPPSMSCYNKQSYQRLLHYLL